jgi:hypothetical protein
LQISIESQKRAGNETMTQLQCCNTSPSSIMSRWFPFSFFFLLILVLLTSKFADAESEIEKKREAILARRDSQKQRLNALIRHMRKQLADHSAGEVLVEPEEKAQLEKRLALYVQKVDSMKDYVDDEEVEVTLAREASQIKYRSNSAQKVIDEKKKEIEEEKQKKEQESRGEEL